jgi:WD40 repeat protein
VISPCPVLPPNERKDTEINQSPLDSDAMLPGNVERVFCQSTTILTYHRDPDGVQQDGCSFSHLDVRYMLIDQTSRLTNIRWDTIQNVFYRKEEIYTMSWKIPDLSDYLVAGAKNGGPIALMRDERKVMLLGRHSAGKPKISIYTSSGLPITTLVWDLSPPILIHFTPEYLLVLSDEGTYRLYDRSNPQVYTQYTLGAEVAELGLVSAKAYDDGFVVLSGGLGFLEVKGWNGGRVSALAASGMFDQAKDMWQHS